MFVVVVCCCCCPAVLGVVEGWGGGLCIQHHSCYIGLALDTPLYAKKMSKKALDTPYAMSVLKKTNADSLKIIYAN